MTADAPAAGAHPVRFAQPVVVALASAGVVTLTARQLFGYPQIVPDASAPVLTWLAPIVAVLMLTAPAAVVALRPAVGRGGGWPIVAVGLAVSTLVIQTVLTGSRGAMAPAGFLVVAAGFAAALSGVVVAAAQAPVAEQVAIAAGVAFGFAAQRDNLLVFEPYRGTDLSMLPFYVIIGLAVAASVMALARPALYPSRRGFGAAGPVLVAVAVTAIIQLGRHTRGMDAVTDFAEYWPIVLACVAGLILAWFGHGRGQADLARWIVLGFALGGPSVIVIFGFYFGGLAQESGLGLTALLATAAGVVAALRADRLFAWDALGVALTAIGMILGSVSYRLGASVSLLAYLLITGGFAFALAFGLTRIVRSATATVETVGAGQVALSLSLGLVALLATADAISPAAWLLVGGSRLGVPVITLTAAGVLLLLSGLRPAREPTGREIHEHEQAAPPPSP